MLSELRKSIKDQSFCDLADDAQFWSATGNMFALKVVEEFRHGYTNQALFDSCFHSSLHAAAAENQRHVLKFLLGTGLNVNRVTNGTEIVARAAKRGHCDSVYLLVLDYGASLNIPGSYPIHAAVTSQQPWQQLLSLGADINHKNQEGATLLMTAMIHDCSHTYFIQLAFIDSINLDEGDDEYAIDLESRRVSP